MATILVVDDAPQVQSVLRFTLSRAGHEVLEALPGEAALEIASRDQIDLALIDNKLPGMSGLDVFRRLRTSHPLVPGIVITGYASVPNAVEAMRAGIVDYVSKPFTPREVMDVVERVLERAKAQPRPDVRSEAPATPAADPSFVDVNCATIPATLVESELFGHQRDAFADAREAKPGKFELAHRGTLFLDEIGDMPVEAQGKILRAPERRGGGAPRRKPERRGRCPRGCRHQCRS